MTKINYTYSMLNAGHCLAAYETTLQGKQTGCFFVHVKNVHSSDGRLTKKYHLREIE